jgi:hypothetical protein
MNDLKYERDFWGTCVNTFDEEVKHAQYAHGMGLPRDPGQTLYDVHDRNIIDIGGGPVSLLLKTRNLKAGLVIDPLEFPPWVTERYKAHGIRLVPMRGEDILHGGWDEAWIYNCLQHTDDPELIIENAMEAALVLRLFEWIDLPVYDGHPQALTQALLEKWIGQPGIVIKFKGESNCWGKAFCGWWNV